tara:strand:+ start:92 stop:493 length:402 start_codon:yes stop_codon:yes gene_type:complete
MNTKTKQSAKTQKAINPNIDLGYQPKRTRGGANSETPIELLTTTPVEPSEAVRRKLNGTPDASQAQCIIKVLVNQANETGSATCTVGQMIGKDLAGKDSLLDQVPEFKTKQTPARVWGHYLPILEAWGMIKVG